MSTQPDIVVTPHGTSYVVLRVAKGQFASARVYDHRFGSKALAFTVRTTTHGVSVSWPSTPAWGKKHG